MTLGTVVFFGVCVLLLAVLFAFVLVFPKRFGVVAWGRVYRSARPRARQLPYLIPILKVRCIVALQLEEKPRHVAQLAAEDKACQRRGIRLVRVPLADQDLVPPPAACRQLADVLGDATAYPLLIHCGAGRHRTGLVAALYQLTLGHGDPVRAERELLRYWITPQDRPRMHEWLNQVAVRLAAVPADRRLALLAAEGEPRA